LLIKFKGIKNLLIIKMGQGIKNIYGESVNTAALLEKEEKLNKDRIVICPHTISGLNSQS
tara:strand:- start:178 stop:357 length:180 start_codon:yes stop_codon:yes gene_type:complete